ncbi:MAG TPA: CCA tRNA nucleotidyltransferase [Fimbriiglobus sp.]|jgi:poly(A) polymerase
MTERDFAADVVRTLQAAGHVAYFAGGCVRDELLGLTPADHDVATDAVPERVQQLFRRTIAIGAAFGVIEVLGPRMNGEHINVQVATFRSDGSYTDGRRPNAVTFGNAEADAARRDFTINGLFFDPVAERLYDFVGGRADLESKVLRAIGDPAARFTEDKLRILRAVRLAARFDLTIDPATWFAGRRLAEQIFVVSAERIAEELRKMLAHPTRAKAVEWLNRFELVTPVFPEVAASVETRTETVRYLPDRFGFEGTFATLLLDTDPKAAGAIGRRLKLSADELRHVAWLVGHQSALTGAAGQSKSKLYPILAHPFAPDLIAIDRARVAAEGCPSDDADFSANVLRELQPEVINPPPLITGDDLTAAGYTPGPDYKGWLERVRAAQLDGEVKSKEEALALVARLRGPGHG